MVRFRHAATHHPSPSAQHRFVEPGDSRSALALGSLQPGLQVATPLAVADASMRLAHCAVPGCGKERDNPIHAPSE
jgi:hypothetical protein